jgi:hypothetical protein
VSFAPGLVAAPVELDEAEVAERAPEGDAHAVGRVRVALVLAAMTRLLARRLAAVSQSSR